MNRRNAAYALALLLGLAVAAVGFASSFSNLSTYAAAHGWWFPQALPLGLDLGIPALLILDWLRASMFLRGAAWSLAGFTVFANGAVAGGSTVDRLLHAMMPAVAILIVEAARHLRDDPTRMDKIRASRWLLSPVRTARLRRRMVLWEITSYSEALTRESAILHARTVLASAHGCSSWRKARKLVPLTLRHQLGTGELPLSLLHGLDPQAAIREWIGSELQALKELADRRRHVICSGPSGVVFLRRPTPRRSTEPGGPVGARVVDMDEVLQGAHGPVVYFIRNGNRVKIGTSTNLRSRISTLCLRAADITLVLHGGADYERQLHQQFAEYRVTSSEWFRMTGDLAAFVATGGPSPETSLEVPERHNPDVGTTEPNREPGERQGPASSAAGHAANSSAETGTTGDADAEPDVEASERQQARRTVARKRRKNTRRSMNQWVALAEPVWRQEFARLHRQPTGIEFAQAIKKARLGTVSESTAKKIRTEILDRAPLSVASPDGAAPDLAGTAGLNGGLST